ncbi:MAG: GNAT family N-acetyltransferase [Actinobacteria bacterium]|nr:GNAT family N-acetyltransferase [Actinomycetota bacterium]
MGDVRVQRARIEEIRPLADEYRAESSGASSDGLPWDAPIPQGGIFWIARDSDTREPLGYAAGTLRPSGCTVGPVFTRPEARRRGVGDALVSAIQEWAEGTRVPVVEISVAADNPEGKAFLESLGYEPRRILMSLKPGER